MRLSTVGAVLAVLVLAAPARTHATKIEMGVRMSFVTDEDLIQRLSSPDEETSGMAALAIYARGERMIPLLVPLRGKTQLFTGAGYLVSPHSSTMVFTRPGPGIPEDQLVSVEVAALYLINAMYAGRMDFATSPYISDLNLPPNKRTTANRPELVERAWKSVEIWSKDLKPGYLEDLRNEKRRPLDAGRVAFW
jgi:hypothetical protein